MQTTGKFFDDFARMTGGAAGVFAGLRDEVEAMVKSRLERVLAEMDVVPRDEFDAMRAVAVKAREEQEKLEERVAALEAQVEKLSTGKAPAGRKSAARKTTARRKTASGETD